MKLHSSAWLTLSILLSASLSMQSCSTPQSTPPPPLSPPAWTPAPPTPACAIDDPEGAPLLDEALESVGLTRGSFRFDDEDLKESPYSPSGALLDPFLLSFLPKTRGAPARAGCFEGEVITPLTHFGSLPTPVAHIIRHQAALLDRPTTSPPLGPEDFLGDFTDAIRTLCQLAGEPCTEVDGHLPEELEQLLRPLGFAILKAALSHRAMTRTAPEQTPDWWFHYGGNQALLTTEATGPDTTDPAQRAYLLGARERADLYDAAALIAHAIENTNWSDAAELAETVSFDWKTPYGLIRVRGTRNHYYPDTEDF